VGAYLGRLAGNAIGGQHRRGVRGL
jgi:hypothetical protein